MNIIVLWNSKVTKTKLFTNPSHFLYSLFLILLCVLLSINWNANVQKLFNKLSHFFFINCSSTIFIKQCKNLIKLRFTKRNFTIFVSNQPSYELFGLIFIKFTGVIIIILFPYLIYDSSKCFLSIFNTHSSIDPN